MYSFHNLPPLTYLGTFLDRRVTVVYTKSLKINLFLENQCQRGEFPAFFSTRICVLKKNYNSHYGTFKKKELHLPSPHSKIHDLICIDYLLQIALFCWSGGCDLWRSGQNKSWVFVCGEERCNLFFFTISHSVLLKKNIFFLTFFFFRRRLINLTNWIQIISQG